MRTEVPAVVSKRETCEQETGWADFISIEISKKALFCRPTLFRNEFRELLIRAKLSAGPPEVFGISRGYSMSLRMRIAAWADPDCRLSKDESSLCDLVSPCAQHETAETATVMGALKSVFEISRLEIS